MGTVMHELNVGDEMQFKGPNQQWAYERNKYKTIYMLAGGTGTACTDPFPVGGPDLANPMRLHMIWHMYYAMVSRPT